MTKTRAQRRKFGVGSLLLLLMLGAIFLAIGVAILTSSRINRSWVRVTGKVSDMTTTQNQGATVYAPVVTYEVAGQPYTVTSDVGTVIFPQLGSSRQVAYDPRLPASAVVVQAVGIRVVYYILPVIGVGMLVAGPLAYVRSRRHSSDIRQLEQAGQKRQGIIVDIQSSRPGTEASSYRLVVAAENDAGAIQNYVSDTLAGIGALAATDFRARPVPLDVYVDPAKPDNYYVDISEVPNLTSRRVAELIQSIAPPPKLEMASVSPAIAPATPDLSLQTK